MIRGFSSATESDAGQLGFGASCCIYHFWPSKSFSSSYLHQNENVF